MNGSRTVNSAPGRLLLSKGSSCKRAETSKRRKNCQMCKQQQQQWWWWWTEMIRGRKDEKSILAEQMNKRQVN